MIRALVVALLASFSLRAEAVITCSAPAFDGVPAYSFTGINTTCTFPTYPVNANSVPAVAQGSELTTISGNSIVSTAQAQLMQGSSIPAEFLPANITVSWADNFWVPTTPGDVLKFASNVADSPADTVQIVTGPYTNTTNVSCIGDGVPLLVSFSGTFTFTDDASGSANYTQPDAQLTIERFHADGFTPDPFVTNTDAVPEPTPYAMLLLALPALLGRRLVSKRFSER